MVRHLPRPSRRTALLLTSLSGPLALPLIGFPITPATVLASLILSGTMTAASVLPARLTPTHGPVRAHILTMLAGSVLGLLLGLWSGVLSEGTGTLTSEIGAWVLVCTFLPLLPLLLLRVPVRLAAGTLRTARSALRRVRPRGDTPRHGRSRNAGTTREGRREPSKRVHRNRR